MQEVFCVAGRIWHQPVVAGWVSGPAVKYKQATDYLLYLHSHAPTQHLPHAQHIAPSQIQIQNPRFITHKAPIWSSFQRGHVAQLFLRFENNLQERFYLHLKQESLKTNLHYKNDKSLLPLIIVNHATKSSLVDELVQ